MKGISTIQKVGLNFPNKIIFGFAKLSFAKLFNIHNYCTISLNNTKSPWCTSIHGALSNNTKSTMEGVVVWEIPV
jgi:hypothetical protein